MNRVRLQRAYPVSQGTALAFGRGKLPREFFDALARHPSQVDTLEFEANAEKERRELMAKHGFDPD
jgi:hypothetical protein